MYQPRHRILLQFIGFYFLIRSKRLTVLRKINHIEIGINHPVLKYMCLIPANQKDYICVSLRKHGSEFRQRRKFLFRDSFGSFNQRKLKQIFPDVIARSFINQSIRTHTYIYIIEGAIGRFRFVLFYRKLCHHSPG